ncbi:MAG TPA: ATP-binding protein [Anaerolineaceae bacterium]
MSPAFEFLKNVPLFADLSEADLQQLCEAVKEVRLHTGDMLFFEGDPGRQAYVIKEGQIEIYKTTEGREIQLSVRQPGEVIGEMALLESAPRMASGRAMSETLLLEISQEDLDHLLDTHPAASRVMLRTVTGHLRNTTAMLNQSEKMAQLGTLSAGIAHELNNPAAAARRGAEQLRGALERLQGLQMELAGYNFSPEQNHHLVELESHARQGGSHPLQLEALARSDRQSELEDWLDEHDVENGWDLAPQLVPLGIKTDELDQLVETFPIKSLPAVIAWMGITGTLYSLLEEIGQGTSRISEIVKALKSYVYLDQAPVQNVDVHEGIENTLVMLRHKLKQGVEVRRDYDPNLPHIQVYGSELNQVWTNLIDNAVDAMDGHGELLIRTRYDPPWVVVEIQDSGPGIPPQMQARMFTPFFTTKPLGKGTGLGLNISYNIVHKHKGDIRFTSHPGETCFEVRLPVDS